MAEKYLTVEVFHVTVVVPAELSDAAAGEARAALAARPVVAELRAAVAAVVAAHTPLTVVRLTVAR